MNIPSSWDIAKPPIASVNARDVTGSKSRSNHSFSSHVTLIALGIDFLAISAGSVAALLTYGLFSKTHVGNEGWKLFAFTVQYAVAFILFGRIHFLYSYGHNLLRIRDTAGILRVSTYCFLLLSVESFFSKLMIMRGLLVLGWVFITVFVLFEKHAVRRMFARWKAMSAETRRVLILGSGPEARRIFSYLLNSPGLQMHPVAFLEDKSSSDPRVVYSHDYRFKDHATVYSGDLSGEILTSLNISDIFIADPMLAQDKIVEIAALSAQYSAQLSFVASVQPALFGSPVNFRVMDGLFISSYSCELERNAGYEAAKRVLDIIISLSMLLASLPIWLVAAAWVKLSSKGPIFFQQERIGRDGKPFNMLKFRSMYITAPKYGRSPTETHDPRITTAGRFLRKTSLDELPQLLNVLMGQMSMVGPRPEMPYVVSQYTAHQRQRLNVHQGLTGMWQLSADRKFAIHESLEYDLYYVENRGLFLDLAILLHTAAFAMKGI